MLISNINWEVFQESSKQAELSLESLFFRQDEICRVNFLKWGIVIFLGWFKKLSRSILEILRVSLRCFNVDLLLLPC